MDNAIAKSLGIGLNGEILEPVKENRDMDISEDIGEDFNKARTTILSRMGDLEDVISEVKDIAAQSQHPRFYEVLGGLLKTSIESSRELLALQRQKNEIAKMNRLPERGQTTNNLLVATTGELLAILQKAQS